MCAHLAVDHAVTRLTAHVAPGEPGVALAPRAARLLVRAPHRRRRPLPRARRRAAGLTPALAGRELPRRPVPLEAPPRRFPGCRHDAPTIAEPSLHPRGEGFARDQAGRRGRRSGRWVETTGCGVPVLLEAASPRHWSGAPRGLRDAPGSQDAPGTPLPSVRSGARYAPAVTAYLRGKGSEEPEELTSETFLALFRALPEFRGDEAGLKALAVHDRPAPAGGRGTPPRPAGRHGDLGACTSTSGRRRAPRRPPSGSWGASRPAVCCSGSRPTSATS